MTLLRPDTRFKLPFAGSGSLERHFSQAGQDLFVLEVLDGKCGGVFLDLGCNHPIMINNTFLLEKEFGWSGLCFDVDPQFQSFFAFRSAPMIVADCTRLDWDEIADRAGTSSFDYLSLDLEPPLTTLEGLKNIPFGKVDFSVITFEHDAYRAGEDVRGPSRKILEEYGYVRVCSNVRLAGLEFEDWYVNPAKVKPDRYTAVRCEDQAWENIIFDAH